MHLLKRDVPMMCIQAAEQGGAPDRLDRHHLGIHPRGIRPPFLRESHRPCRPENLRPSTHINTLEATPVDISLTTALQAAIGCPEFHKDHTSRTAQHLQPLYRNHSVPVTHLHPASGHRRHRQKDFLHQRTG